MKNCWAQAATNRVTLGSPANFFISSVVGLRMFPKLFVKTTSDPQCRQIETSPAPTFPSFENGSVTASSWREHQGHWVEIVRNDCNLLPRAIQEFVDLACVLRNPELSAVLSRLLQHHLGDLQQTPRFVLIEYLQQQLR